MESRHTAIRSVLRVESTGLLLSILIGLLVQSPLAASAAPPDGPGLYHDYCSVCHGERGDGQSRARGSMVPPPRDFTTPGAASDLTRERMLASVRDGRAGTAMVGWKTQLSELEIDAVVSYVRERLMMPVATEDAEHGRRLYANTCSVCHGDDGRGARWTMTNFDPLPRNFTRPETRAEISRDQMIQVATYGKPNTAMPAFQRQLSPADLEAVVDYVLAAFVPTAQETTPALAGEDTLAATSQAAVTVDMAAPMPRGLVGDALRGTNLYMTNCVVCHGLEGDGEGPRAYFILPKPRNFLHSGSRQKYDRPALFLGISRGSLGAEMPAWDTVLDDQQIADVAEYVFQTFIRGTSGSNSSTARAQREAPADETGGPRARQ